jgi:hypothetical protein
MNLFDRLPLGIFAPLTGRNSRRAWELLNRLAVRYFGPTCVPPFPEGYLLEHIIKEVERFLVEHDWEEEESPATTLSGRAAALVSRFAETGWLVKEVVGMRTFVSMRPTVMRLFETLLAFATERPQHVGGSIQLVFSQLQSVQKDPRGQAAGFNTAAQLCSKLIASLNATTMRARDLIKDLLQENSTPSFIHRFFTEHIGEMYVQDFQQLRTENHPLSLRFEIINIVWQITHDEVQRSSLIDGYITALNLQRDKAEAALDEDVERFRRLLDVEQFLDRMDSVIESATQRALNVINYRLKASDRLEFIIDDSLDALAQAEERDIEVRGAWGRVLPAIAECRLQFPHPAPPKPQRKPMIKPQLSVRDRAVHELRRAMIASRDMSTSAAKNFVERMLADGETLEASAIPINEVRDAVAYLVLLRLASQKKGGRSNARSKQLGFDVKLSGSNGGVADTALFKTSNFVVSREATDAA